MDLFEDLITAVQSDLSVSSNSSFFPTATIKLAINRAYKKAGVFKWTALQDSQKTSTTASGEYYDAPTTWRPNSIWRLEVDGDMYGQDPDGSPLKFDDFLTWKENNPNSTDKKWAVQWLRYFLNPIPSAIGDKNITIWGYKNVSELVNDADTTIFSYNMPECNDAIVMEASAILKNKAEDNKTGQFLSAEAKNILSITFNGLTKDSSKQEKNQPFFQVPDYFGRGYSNYNVDPEDF